MGKSYVSKIVDFMVEEAEKYTDSGSWAVYYCELNEEFKFASDEWLDNHLTAILREFNQREEIADLSVVRDKNGNPCGFDFVLWLMYCQNAEFTVDIH